MLLGRYKQQPGERRKRALDYTGNLEATEVVDDVDVSVLPADGLTVTTVTIDPAGKKIGYYAGGGDDGVEYTVTFKVHTTGGQTFEDEVAFDVEEIDG